MASFVTSKELKHAPCGVFGRRLVIDVSVTTFSLFVPAVRCPWTDVPLDWRACGLHFLKERKARRGREFLIAFTKQHQERPIGITGHGRVLAAEYTCQIVCHRTAKPQR